MRFSHDLLHAMSVLNAEEKKSTHCEAWPATVVLHSNQDVWEDGSVYASNLTASLARGMKAVYVLHPVYFTHKWPQEELSAVLKKPDFHAKVNERVMSGASFYDASASRRFYAQWAGAAATCMAPTLVSAVNYMVSELRHRAPERTYLNCTQP